MFAAFSEYMNFTYIVDVLKKIENYFLLIVFKPRSFMLKQKTRPPLMETGHICKTDFPSGFNKEILAAFFWM